MFHEFFCVYGDIHRTHIERSSGSSYDQWGKVTYHNPWHAQRAIDHANDAQVEWPPGHPDARVLRLKVCLYDDDRSETLEWERESEGVRVLRLMVSLPAYGKGHGDDKGGGYKGYGQDKGKGNKGGKDQGGDNDKGHVKGAGGKPDYWELTNAAINPPQAHDDSEEKGHGKGEDNNSERASEINDA